MAAHGGQTWWQGWGTGCPFSLGTAPALAGTFIFRVRGHREGTNLQPWGFLGWERGSPRWSLFSPQFRENLQDVLPSLPSQDDHFLLKWLRGNPGVGGDRDGGLADPWGAVELGKRGWRRG